MDPLEQLRAAIAAEVEKLKAAGKSAAEIGQFVGQAMKEVRDTLTKQMTDGFASIEQEYGATPNFDKEVEEYRGKVAVERGLDAMPPLPEFGRAIIDDEDDMGSPEAEDPDQPPYTSALPAGSQKGKPYPSEEEWGGGDDYYSNVYRWEKDNGVPKGMKYKSPEYMRFVDDYQKKGGFGAAPDFRREGGNSPNNRGVDPTLWPDRDMFDREVAGSPGIDGGYTQTGGPFMMEEEPPMAPQGGSPSYDGQPRSGGQKEPYPFGLDSDETAEPRISDWFRKNWGNAPDEEVDAEIQALAAEVGEAKRDGSYGGDSSVIADDLLQRLQMLKQSRGKRAPRKTMSMMGPAP